MTSVFLYRPFIDDPNDIARLEGQRYVVLRPTGGVPDIHRHVRSLIKKQLANCEVPEDLIAGLEPLVTTIHGAPAKPRARNAPPSVRRRAPHCLAASALSLARAAP